MFYLRHINNNIPFVSLVSKSGYYDVIFVGLLIASSSRFPKNWGEKLVELYLHKNSAVKKQLQLGKLSLIAYARLFHRCNGNIIICQNPGVLLWTGASNETTTIQLVLKGRTWLGAVKLKLTSALSQRSSG